MFGGESVSPVLLGSRNDEPAGHGSLTTKYLSSTRRPSVATWVGASMGSVPLRLRLRTWLPLARSSLSLGNVFLRHPSHERGILLLVFSLRIPFC